MKCFVIPFDCLQSIHRKNTITKTYPRWKSINSALLYLYSHIVYTISKWLTVLPDHVVEQLSVNIAVLSVAASSKCSYNDVRYMFYLH